MDPAKALTKIYGEPVRVSRIYLCKDGRRRVDLIAASWLKTYALARLKLEIKIKRRLTDNEDADHKDGDHTNDAYSNLQVLTKQQNAAKAARRRRAKPVACSNCGERFIPSRHQTGCGEPGVVPRKAGPFCSKSCTGKYGASVRNTGLRKGRQQTSVSYYTFNNSGKERRVK